jgi:hypothetical protein
MAGKLITVKKLNPFGKFLLSWKGEVIKSDNSLTVIQGRYRLRKWDLGYMILEPDDIFTEYYFKNKWFNIFEIRSGKDNHLKGWYCNIAEPPKISENEIIWTDLLLDIFISPEGKITITDEDEFERLNLKEKDKDSWENSIKAKDEIIRMFKLKKEPFDKK